MAKLEIQHRALMEEEDIDESSLPQEIQDKIKQFDTMLDEYKNDPTEKGKKDVITLDVDIADDIQTHLEEEEEARVKIEEDKKNAEKVKADAKKKEDDDKAEAKRLEDLKNATPPPPPAPTKTQEQEMEEAIRGKMANNMISIDELTKILGKKPERPTVVGKLKLDKKFLVDFFEVVK